MTSPSPRLKRRITRLSRSARASANAELAKLFGRDNLPDIKIKTGARRGVGGPGQKSPYPPMPLDWLGTLPEWAIYWAHLSLGLKPELDFAYVYKLEEAPRGVDFFEFDLQMAIEIQGLYWHYGFGAAKQLNDLERKIRLEALGITVIFIDEDHALQDPVYFLREARNGVDHSRASTGMV